MKTRRLINAILFVVVVLVSVGWLENGWANEFSGYLSVEGHYFLESPRLDDQDRNSASFAFQPEYYHAFPDGASVTIVPFARYDSADKERSHFDIREMNLLVVEDDWEMRVGVGKVFWGVTEFVHLVDIINQTDAVESVDGEEKLGQPMIQLSLIRDYGDFSFFLLPFFRERTFPGTKGRLRSDLPVEWDNATYENGDKRYHVDFAIRYSHSIGDWDFGIYHFNGTGRDPAFRPNFNASGIPFEIVPYYEQINQTGLDVQMVAGSWLFKLESIFRTDQSEYSTDFTRLPTKKDFWASVGGFEYTLVRIFGTAMDLGLIGEYAYDQREEKATTPFENDLMAGFRLTVNDAQSTEILAGYAQDLDHAAKLFSVEASRRFGSNWKLNLETRVFFDPSDEDLLYSLRDDDFLQVELAYYF